MCEANTHTHIFDMLEHIQGQISGTATASLTYDCCALLDSVVDTVQYQASAVTGSELQSSQPPRPHISVCPGCRRRSSDI